MDTGIMIKESESDGGKKKEKDLLLCVVQTSLNDFNFEPRPHFRRVAELK